VERVDECSCFSLPLSISSSAEVLLMKTKGYFCFTEHVYFTKKEANQKKDFLFYLANIAFIANALR